jgi:hypothetical protein
MTGTMLPETQQQPLPIKRNLDQATSHLQMLGAINLDTFNQWVIHNPGGVCVLIQSLLDRLTIPSRAAMIDSIAAQRNQAAVKGAQGASGGEPVAEVVTNYEVRNGVTGTVIAALTYLPVGTKLYTTPHPSPTASGGEAVAWQKNTNAAHDWRGPHWTECTQEEHAAILAVGHWHDPQPGGMNWPATARALYTTPPPATGSGGEANTGAQGCSS